MGGGSKVEIATGRQRPPLAMTEEGGAAAASLTFAALRSRIQKGDKCAPEASSAACCAGRRPARASGRAVRAKGWAPTPRLARGPQERTSVRRKHAFRLFGLVALAALMALAVGCGRGGGGFGRGGSGGQVVAKVDGKPITQGQLCEALELSDNGNAGRQALESLIVRQLIRG